MFKVTTHYMHVKTIHLYCAYHRENNVGFEHATFLIWSSRQSRKTTNDVVKY